MMKALTRGKLSSQQENMEDVLTSCVFGSLQFVRPCDGIVPFLSAAKNWHNETERLNTVFNSAEEHGDVVYEFWPRWNRQDGNSCEPDVVLTFIKSKVIVLVEAKLHSGKSSRRDDKFFDDQLAREWDNLLQKANERNLTPYLVYLTKDSDIPLGEIKQSVNEFIAKRPELASPEIYWLSWSSLLELDALPDGLAEDFRQLISRLSLAPFGNWPSIRRLPVYNFSCKPSWFTWIIEQKLTNTRYRFE